MIFILKIFTNAVLAYHGLPLPDLEAQINPVIERSKN